MIEASRLLMFESGAAMGAFPVVGIENDRSSGVGGMLSPAHEVVVLEPSGACFTHICQDGTCHRHLTDYCGRGLTDQVAAVVTFRNAHSPRPYLSPRLVGSEDGVSSETVMPPRNVPRRASWPAGGSRSARGSSVMHADGRVEVRAIGGNARLTMSASWRICRVDFAVEVPRALSPLPEPGKAPPSRRTQRYALGGAYAGRAWVSRHFLVKEGEIPTEFAHAVALALEVAEGREGRDGQAGAVSLPLPLLEDTPDCARWNTVQRPYVQTYESVSQGGYPPPGLPAADSRAARGLLPTDALRWASGHGLAGDLAPMKENAGGCTYRVVLDRGDPIGSRGGDSAEAGVMVHVLVHADGTEVLLQGNFVQLMRPLPASPSRSENRLLHVSATSTIQFRVASSPESTSSRSQTSEGGTSRGTHFDVLSLGDIVAQALALRCCFVRCSVKYRGCGRSMYARHRDHDRRHFAAGATGGVLTGARCPPAQGLSSIAGHHPQLGSASRASTWPSDHATRKGAVDVEVIGRQERPGASFVAFSDGRARGTFADRTIVALGPPQFPSGAELAHLSCSENVCDVLADKSSGERLKSPMDSSLADEQERDIECIKPDGTVLRLSWSALMREMRLHGSWGVGGSTFGEGSLTAAYMPGKSADFDSLDSHLRSRVLAVCRFTVSAFTDPRERRDAAMRQETACRVAAAEAQRNRRFVELQRLARKAAPESNDASSESFHPATWSVSEAGRPLRQTLRARIGVDDKENVVLDGATMGKVADDVLGRNAIVARLLEANREALIGRAALQRLA